MPPDPRMVAEAMMQGPEAMAAMMGGLQPGMGAGAPAGMVPPPPSAGAPMGGMPPSGAPVPGDPSLGAATGAPMGAPSASPFPSIDPMVIAGLVTQIKGLQEQDLASLQSQQDVVLAAVVQALGGAGPDPMQGVTEGAAFGAPEGPPMGAPPMGDPGMGAPMEAPAEGGY